MLLQTTKILLLDVGLIWAVAFYRSLLF